MTFNFSYNALHEKRTVPSHMLYFGVKAVFYFFDDNKYTKTRSPLSNDKASKKKILCSRQFSEGNILILLGLSASCTAKKHISTVDI